MAAAVISIGTLLLGKGIPGQIRVLAVDAHPLVQEGLAAVINREEDMAVVATASSGAEALDAVRRYRPDVVTLDLLLPDVPGEELARQILAEFPQTRIVAITSVDGHVHARRALDAGVHGYLTRTVARDQLISAIRQVQSGKRAIPGPIAFSAAKQFIRDTISARNSPRLQVVAGRSRRQTAPVTVLA